MRPLKVAPPCLRPAAPPPLPPPPPPPISRPLRRWDVLVAPAAASAGANVDAGAAARLAGVLTLVWAAFTALRARAAPAERGRYGGAGGDGGDDGDGGAAARALLRAALLVDAERALVALVDAAADAAAAHPPPHRSAGGGGGAGVPPPPPPSGALPLFAVSVGPMLWELTRAILSANPPRRLGGAQLSALFRLVARSVDGDAAAVDVLWRTVGRRRGDGGDGWEGEEEPPLVAGPTPTTAAASARRGCWRRRSRRIPHGWFPRRRYRRSLRGAAAEATLFSQLVTLASAPGVGAAEVARLPLDEEGVEGAAAPAAAAAAPHVYALADAVAPGGRRGASAQVLANRGLTPRRSKARKNPRAKHRAAFERALVRRKGAVVEGRMPTAVYGGEATGINVRTTKSIRF